MGILIIIGLIAIAIVMWAFYENKKKDTYPPPFVEDPLAGERTNFLKGIETVFSGAHTVEQRKQFVDLNKLMINHYLTYEDFRTSYLKLAKQYGVLES